jgi:hypothetical protein
MQPGLNVFIAYHDASFSCTTFGGTCRPGDALTMSAQDFASYNFTCVSHTFAWDFGDGQTATGRFVTHTYAAAGVYQLQVTITSPTQTVTVLQPITVQCTLSTSGMTPTSGTWQGGTTVELSGFGFFGCCDTPPCPCPRVTFGGTDAEVLSCTSAVVRAVSPRHLPGPVVVAVITTGAIGPAVTNIRFSYLADATVPMFDLAFLLLLIGILGVVGIARLR